MINLDQLKFSSLCVTFKTLITKLETKFEVWYLHYITLPSANVEGGPF